MMHYPVVHSEKPNLTLLNQEKNLRQARRLMRFLRNHVDGTVKSKDVENLLATIFQMRNYFFGVFLSFSLDSTLCFGGRRSLLLDSAEFLNLSVLPSSYLTNNS